MSKMKQDEKFQKALMANMSAEMIINYYCEQTLIEEFDEGARQTTLDEFNKGE